MCVVTYNDNIIKKEQTLEIPDLRPYTDNLFSNENKWIAGGQKRDITVHF